MRVPAASTPSVSKRMKGTRKRDTPKELELRRELHHRGLRYLVDAAPLPGVRRRADLVFRGPRVAVFVDGCFWHQCPEHGTIPVSNREWWSDKLTRNVVRDRDTDQKLRAAGWRVIRIWEHESSLSAAQRVENCVRRRAS
jgi:DNA mismatch endonuclease (patch repair protein)